MDNLLLEISKTIKNKHKIDKIFLFGSYATGTPTISSDIDLCIISKLGSRRKLDMIRAIRKDLIDKINKPLDIILYDVEEFNNRAQIKNSFEEKIQNSGILIDG